MRILPAVVVLLLAGAPARAQFLDPDNCWTCAHSREHFVAGAVLDVLWRPLLRPSLNRPVPRVLLTCAVGAVYEGMQYIEARAEGQLGQVGHGFGLMDLALDCAGAAVVEFVQAIVR